MIANVGMAVLEIAFFMCIGEIIYFTLTAKESTIKRTTLLHSSLIIISPLVLIFSNFSQANMDWTFYKIIFGIVIYLMIPSKKIENFVMDHHKSVVSDIPFFDTEKHPIRTIFIVLFIYFGVLTFFLG